MNFNEKTGVPYGYISLSALDDDVVHELLYGSHVQNLSELMRKAEILKEVFNKYDVDCGSIDSVERIHELEELLDDMPGAKCEYGDLVDQADMYAEEDILQGEYQGVTYQVSWLGGAQAFWIFESPVITERAQPASPCLPGAGILNSLTGNVTCYDVPPSWRHQD